MTLQWMGIRFLNFLLREASGFRILVLDTALADSPPTTRGTLDVVPKTPYPIWRCRGRVVTTRNLGNNARGTDALFLHVVLLLTG
jgi:hypothetical protein